MKPQLGDTISNRYVLVSPLREETGLQVWKASDHVLARDCQLFIVSNSKALQEVNATMQSYFGLIKHCTNEGLRENIINGFVLHCTDAARAKARESR